jgi:DNA-binding NarL/FixJ family response regulator
MNRRYHLAAHPRSDAAGKTAVFIVEGDARVSRGIRSVIESFPDLELVGEAARPPAALAFLAPAPTSVAIVDLEPSTAADGLKVVKELSQKGCSVVAISTRSGLGSAAFAAGAVAFVEKDERGAIGLIDAVRTAANNGKLPPGP